MYVDFHGHCVEEAGYPVNGLQSTCTPDQLLAFYDRYDIEMGTILPEQNPETCVGGQSTEEVLRICRAHPGRFIPCVDIDPRAHFNSAFAPMKDILSYYRDKGCRMLGEICANLHFLDPRVQNLFAAAEEVGLPVDFHISPYNGFSYGLVDDKGLHELEICLQRFPKLIFCGHSQPFWAEMGEYDGVEPRFGYPEGPVKEGRIPQLMRKYPNLYGDLSANSGAKALIRDRAYGVRFINEFQDRLMFGMDLCQPAAERSWHALLPPYLKELRDSGEISKEVFEKLERKNAIRVLKLDVK